MNNDETIHSETVDPILVTTTVLEGGVGIRHMSPGDRYRMSNGHTYDIIRKIFNDNPDGSLGITYEITIVKP